MTRRRLPSLSALHAFEAAARHGSFKDAARELSVTPGAISQRIRALEEDMGVALFTRKARAVALTPAGQKLHPEISESFHRMGVAVDEVSAPGIRRLRINSSAPVITKFILPSFHKFAGKNPDLDVSIETQNELNPLDADGPDVALRVCCHPPADRYSKLIHREILLPVASPTLIERLELRTPADVVRAPLLHDLSLSIFAGIPGWTEWFRAAGLAGEVPRRTLEFERQSPDYVIDSAIAGNGIMLGRSSLVQHALCAGHLSCPFGPVLHTSVGLYFLCRHEVAAEPHVAAFRRWADEQSALLSTLYALHGGGQALTAQ